MTKHLTVTWDIKLILTQSTYKTVICCCNFQRSPMCRSPFQLWSVLVSFLFIPKPLPLVIDEQSRLLMVMSPRALMLWEKACI